MKKLLTLTTFLALTGAALGQGVKISQYPQQPAVSNADLILLAKPLQGTNATVAGSNLVKQIDGEAVQVMATNQVPVPTATTATYAASAGVASSLSLPAGQFVIGQFNEYTSTVSGPVYFAYSTDGLNFTNNPVMAWSTTNWLPRDTAWMDNGANIYVANTCGSGPTASSYNGINIIESSGGNPFQELLYIPVTNNASWLAMGGATNAAAPSWPANDSNEITNVICYCNTTNGSSAHFAFVLITFSDTTLTNGYTLAQLTVNNTNMFSGYDACLIQWQTNYYIAAKQLGLFESTNGIAGPYNTPILVASASQNIIEGNCLALLPNGVIRWLCGEAGPTIVTRDAFVPSAFNYTVTGIFTALTNATAPINYRCTYAFTSNTNIFNGPVASGLKSPIVTPPDSLNSDSQINSGYIGLGGIWSPFSYLPVYGTVLFYGPDVFYAGLNASNTLTASNILAKSTTIGTFNTNLLEVVGSTYYASIMTFQYANLSPVGPYFTNIAATTPVIVWETILGRPPVYYMLNATNTTANQAWKGTNYGNGVIQFFPPASHATDTNVVGNIPLLTTTNLSAGTASFQSVVIPYGGVGVVQSTNYVPSSFTPIEGSVFQVASNNWMFVVTPNSTNAVFQIQP